MQVKSFDTAEEMFKFLTELSAKGSAPITEEEHQRRNDQLNVLGHHIIDVAEANNINPVDTFMTCMKLATGIMVRKGLESGDLAKFKSLTQDSLERYWKSALELFGKDEEPVDTIAERAMSQRVRRED